MGMKSNRNRNRKRSRVSREQAAARLNHAGLGMQALTEARTMDREFPNARVIIDGVRMTFEDSLRLAGQVDTLILDMSQMTREETAKWYGVDADVLIPAPSTTTRGFPEDREPVPEKEALIRAFTDYLRENAGR